MLSASRMALTCALALAGVASAQAGVPDGKVGAVYRHGRTVCLSIANSHIAAKTKLVLVDPDSSATGGAEVTGPSADCAQEHQSGYALRTADQKAHSGTVLFGLLAPSGAVSAGPLVSFGPGQEKLALHACTSADGVHLTIWQGKALNGPRLWHSYVYLGQDLDADCSDKETS